MKIKITGKIFGMLPSMKNSRRIVYNRKTGKPMIIKSDEALQFQANAIYQLAGYRLYTFSGPVKLFVRVFYNSKRHDLDIELFCDALQAAGIITNDRIIVDKHAQYFIDKKKPRIEFEIESIKWEY